MYMKPKGCDEHTGCDLMVYFEEMDNGSSSIYFEVQLNTSRSGHTENDLFWIGLGLNAKKQMVPF